MTSFSLYPTPRSVQQIAGEFHPNGLIRADEASRFALDAFCHAVYTLPLTEGDGNVRLIYDESISHPEGYGISIRDTAEIRARSLRGFIYAAATVSQLVGKDGTLPCCQISDEPYKAVRGVHMYLPPADGIREFCRIIDALAHLKYNTLILEIGGGMEYKRHPEINDAWRKFCREARSYQGGPRGVQSSQADWKNSTHVELAGGGVLTQEQMKEIAAYVRGRGMQLIPEIQALSHSYYLTLAHREIAERPYEPFPDTYCPSNEDSYRLYFDVADEIHEVIGYDKVSIGHDEVRILGYCPRCRGKSGHELLAQEICRLHEHYKAMGVEVWMWGEKLQDFTAFNGKRSGGQALDMTDRFGRRWLLPPTYEAIDKVPRDIVMLDWYHSQGNFTEEKFLNRGIKEIYGNFRGSSLENWQKRSQTGNVMGAEVSTWCVANEDEIGRNGWFMEFVFSSAVLWQADYECDRRREFLMRTAQKLADIRTIIRGEACAQNTDFLPVENPEKTHAVSAAADAEFIQSSLSRIAPEGKISFASSSTEAVITPDRKCDTITFLHGADFADRDVPKRVFTWFFQDSSPRILAHYVIEYEDGIHTAIPVEFGVAAGNLHTDFSWRYPDAGEKRFDDESQDDTDGEITEKPPRCTMNDDWIDAAMYFSDVLPVQLDGKDAALYAWTYKNPRPETAIKSIRLVQHKETSVPMQLCGILV